MQTSEDISLKPVGYVELVLANRNFRAVWFGEVISLLGDWFNLIASAMLITSLTDTGVAIGGLFVVRMLAPFLISPLAGVLADRYNRKKLLVGSDLLRCVVVLGYLFVRDPEDIWLLYILTAIQLAIGGIFYPARAAILPDIVDDRELGTANALGATTWSVMLAFGAALGGLATGRWGIYPSFVIDAVTFLLSALCIAQLSYSFTPPAITNRVNLRSLLDEYVEGIRYLRKQSDVLMITIQKGAVALTMGGAFEVVQVSIANQMSFAGINGSSLLGVMYTMGGIGSGLGPLLARRFTGDRNRYLRLALVIAYGIIILGLVIMAPLFSLATLIAGILIQAIGGGINWVFSTQLLLQEASDHVRGRVFSAEFAIFTLANAMGASMSGITMDFLDFNLSGLLWWMALLTFIPGLVWLFWIYFGDKNKRESDKI